MIMIYSSGHYCQLLIVFDSFIMCMGGGEEGLVNCYYVYEGRGKRAWSNAIMCMGGGEEGLVRKGEKQN